MTGSVPSVGPCSLPPQHAAGPPRPAAPSCRPARHRHLTPSHIQLGWTIWREDKLLLGKDLESQTNVGPPEENTMRRPGCAQRSVVCDCFPETRHCLSRPRHHVMYEACAQAVGPSITVCHASENVCQSLCHQNITLRNTSTPSSRFATPQQTTRSCTIIHFAEPQPLKVLHKTLSSVPARCLRGTQRLPQGRALHTAESAPAMHKKFQSSAGL